MFASLTATLDSERRFWHFCTLLLGVIAVLRGANRPNTWIITQAQITYSQGFVKRALFGELFTRHLHLYTSGRYTVASYVFLGLALALLVLFTVRSGISARIGNGELTTLFFSSYALTYFVSDVGYFDALLLVLTVPLLLMRSDRLRLMIGVPLCSLALLFHEMFLLSFLPLILLTFVLSYQTSSDASKRRWALGSGVALGLFCLAIALIIAWRPTLSAAKIAALEADVRATSRFPVRHDFFVVLSRSFFDNFHLMLASFYSDPGWWISQIASIFFFGPVLLLLWLSILRLLCAAGLRQNRMLFWAVGFASLSPVALHGMGFDSVRWNGLIVFTTFLVLLTLCYRTKGAFLPATTRFKHACILAIILSMSSSGSLIAGHVYSYPFVNDPGFFYGIHALLHGKDATPQIQTMHP